jgi:hypothetical protein
MGDTGLEPVTSALSRRTRLGAGGLRRAGKGSTCLRNSRSGFKRLPPLSRRFPSRCAPGVRQERRAGREHRHWRARPWHACSSELQPRRRGHHWCPASVHRADDLLGINALQMDASGPQVGVPQLALARIQRHPLARELDRVRVTLLVRRETNPGLGCADLSMCAAGRAPASRNGN